MQERAGSVAAGSVRGAKAWFAIFSIGVAMLSGCGLKGALTPAASEPAASHPAATLPSASAASR